MSFEINDLVIDDIKVKVIEEMSAFECITLKNPIKGKRNLSKIVELNEEPITPVTTFRIIDQNTGMVGEDLYLCEQVSKRKIKINLVWDKDVTIILSYKYRPNSVKTTALIPMPEKMIQDRGYYGCDEYWMPLEGLHMLSSSYLKDIEFLNIGKGRLSKDKFKAVGNGYLKDEDENIIDINKPYGGLWASVYTPDEIYKSSWQEYVYFFDDVQGLIRKKHYKNKKTVSSVFSLKPNARILMVNSLDDYKRICTFAKRKLIKLKYDWLDINEINYLDYDILSSAFDGIYLTRRGAEELTGFNIGIRYSIQHEYNKNYNMSDWSTESLCLFNYDCIDKKRTIHLDNWDQLKYYGD